MLVFAGVRMSCDMRCLKARSVTVGGYMVCGSGWPRELLGSKLGETINGIGTCECVNRWQSLCTDSLFGQTSTHFFPLEDVTFCDHG